MQKDKDLIKILNPLDLYTEEDLCGNCKYKSSFLCNKRFAIGVKETYLEQYDIKLYVYWFKTNNLMKIIELLHKKEVKHHRNGEYFALQATNFHCGEYCDCNCETERCWKIKVKSRLQPHCIKFFNLKIPDDLKSKNIAYVLGNEEYGK